ncbi:34442_t:CDS:2, partial [Racocetra persica]
YQTGNQELTPTMLRQSVKEISRLVKEIYQHNLLTSLGRETLDYLREQRQLTPQLLDRFSLGCSISNYQISKLLFPQQHFAANLSSTNLVQINDNYQVQDYFSSSQLILPLFGEKGEIIAFASRKTNPSSSESKYNYLPNYSNYQKSSLLYNYSAVRQHRAEDCYLVEGFFDVISLTKSGVENCLALLGTNCSERQVQLLHQLKKRIILFLDGDQAGREATLTIALTLLAHEIDCEVISYPYSGDPDEICQIQENPQRSSRFVEEVTKLFTKFPENIKRF